MPSFTYTARDHAGKVQAGFLDALSEDEVVAVLQHRGLLVTSISRKDLRNSAGFMSRQRPRRMHGGVSVDDQVLLCQQLSTLVEAGVPLLKGLEVVGMQVESRQLLLALEDVRRNVEAGRTFRDALSQHPKVFPKLWLNLVETGEASGHLAQALQQLSHHFEAAQHLRNEAKTAMTYPAFLVIAAMGVLAVFLYVIIPKFTGMFASMQMELPLLTRIVIGISEAAKRYVIFIVFGVVAMVTLVRQYLRTESGQWLRDRLLLRMPLLGALFTYIQLAEFSRGLATLLESGVPLLSSLEILEDSATNRLYGKAIGTVKDFVEEGKPMAQPMAETGLFPPMAVQMVLVGEEVGELAKMVTRIARFYEERLEIAIARMTRLFEPVAIVVMGGLVLIIVLSVFMPIFKMAGGVSGG